MPKQLRRFGKATLWNQSGIRVLNLKGTSREMAAQHGALLAEEIRAGALPHLARRNAHLITQSRGLTRRRWIAALMRLFVNLTIKMPLLGRVPKRYREEMHAIAVAAGIPSRLVREAALQPDVLMILISTWVEHRAQSWFAPEWRRALARGVMGCTSVVASGPATASGALVHGRNMDYPAVGLWDRFPTVLYFDPEQEPEQQRYVAVSSAGVHSAGITGMNESGITLATHWHCGRPVTAFGVPGQFIGGEIVRRARKISDAIDIARSMTSAGTWTFVVSSAQERKVVAIEIVRGSCKVREPNESCLVHTNFFHDETHRNSELGITQLVAQDSAQRYARAAELLAENKGLLNYERIAAVLGDQFDRNTNREASVGNTISVVTTVNSLISELESGRFWVSCAQESPASLGDYVEFRIDQVFDTLTGSESAPVFKRSDHTCASKKGSARREGLRLFRKAYVAFHTNNDLTQATKFIGLATRADPGEPRYHYTYGHFLMRQKMPYPAMLAFERALGCELGIHEERLVRLFLGHAYDCLNYREKAVKMYLGLLDIHETKIAPIDRHLLIEAKRCLRVPFDINRSERFIFDLQFCDALNYD